MLQKWSNNFHKNCRKTFWSLTNCHLSFVTFDYTRKKGQNFFSLERLPFFSKLCVSQQLLRCYRSDVITSTVIVGISFGPLQNVPWGLSHSIIPKKNAKIFFSLESLPFFSKNCFPQPLRFFKIWSYYFRSETQITSWTLTKCCLRFVILDNSIIGEKEAKIFFSLEKLPFFSKFCVFKQPLRCHRIDLISSTVIVGLSFGPLPIVFWGLSHSIILEKNRPNFCHRAESFFWKVWFSNY